MKLKGNWKKRIARLLVFVMLLTCVSVYPKHEVKAADYSGDGCVRWVKDRAAQIGIILPATGTNSYGLYGASAYWTNLPAQYKRGSEPAANALAIWEFNNGLDGNGGKCGHVAFVESVNGDNVTVTEGGCNGGSYGGNTGVICRTQNKSQMATLGGCSGFLGYVYLAGSGDTNGPLYSDFHVGELWEGGFTVMAKVTDSSGISSVRYAIWTEDGGQDDIKWYNGNCTDGNDYYWSRINFFDHKNEKGKYIIHMYAYDTAGNLTNAAIEYDFSSNGPLYSDFHVGELWEGGFTVMAKVTSVNGVKSVRYAVWTEDGGQDDIKWYNGNCTDGNDYYWSRINFFDHKNEKGKYNIHMYAYDSAGKLTNSGIKYDFNLDASGENEDVFQIEDGVLVGYTGEGGDVVIPEGVTSIGTGVFGECSGLTSVIIPDTVTQIGDYAFWNCSYLRSISIPPNVTSIGYCAFYNTIWLETEREKNPLVIVNHMLIDGKAASGDVVIPEGVTIIGDGAFRFGIYGCDNLTSITIPEGVTHIGKRAFENCNSLKNVTIPESVNHIGDFAFNGYANDFAILITAGSYVEIYAKNNDIPCRYIEENAHTCSYQNQITTQPGCTTIGVRTYTCSECGDSYTEIIAATGHKYTKATIEPICIAKGTTTYTCSICRHSYKEEIPATGHKYTKTTTNPTCTVDGAVTCTCSVCKHSYIEKTLSAAGHKYITTTVAATMGKNGVITTLCEVCKEKKLTTINAPKAVSLSKTESIYNGKQQKPGVTVKDVKGKTLRNGIDYTVSYQKDMKNVGIHVVAVSFKGNYSGKTEMIFCINPKGTSIFKAKLVKNGFELKWKKQSSQTTGYEITYSTSKKFSKKNTKTSTFKKNKTTSKTVSKLKANKKYYVRIRTYKTVRINEKSTKLYSGWSKVKMVKTRK